MFGPIKVIAIDDEPSHLLAITTGLTASGIACMGYWFDGATNELKPTPPQGGLSCLRLIFMDLNLAELGGVQDTAAICGVVMQVLSQVVAKNGGPYLIVFWTQIETKVDDVASMVYERLEKIYDIHCPIAITELAKGQFMVTDPKQADFKNALREFYGELHGQIKDLGTAVQKVIAVNPQLNALVSWEKRASEAAARAVNEIFVCAKDDSPNPLTRSESLQKVTAKIAVAASGEKPASASPARALDAGMADILVDQFGASVEDQDYQNVIKEAIGQTLNEAISFSDDVQMFAALNTFFHIDTETSTTKTWDRGVVISAKPPLDRNVLGFSARDLITTEFLFPHELFPEAKRDDIRTLLTDFRQAAEVVLVEIGADCDHAQDNDRTRRYLVGLEVPKRFLELSRFHANDKLRNESLQMLGPWNVNGQTIYLLVSCRRFWTWQKNAPPPGAVRYRLRASIVSKLLHHYSVWSSRPGIVEFR